MKYCLAFALICSSFNIFAGDNTGIAGYPGYPGGGMYAPGIGPGYGVKYDPCITNLNLSLSGYSSLTGKSPIIIDDSGKLVIDSKKIKSLNTKGNVKTIEYKSINPYGGEETINKVDVTEEKGKIVHITRYEDLAAIKKWNQELKAVKASGFPMLTKTDITFEHQEAGCKIASSELTMEKDGKEEIKVTHDKKLCDDIAPMLNQMGRQNATQCAGLFSQVEESYKARNKEFAKQGKELMMAGMYGMSADPDFGSKSRDWTTMSVISNCMMTDTPIFPGMGFGIGMGYPGVGTNGGFPTGTSGDFQHHLALL